MKYSDDFIVLEVAFISGRPKEIRLALLKELNVRIVARAGISPDDLTMKEDRRALSASRFTRHLSRRCKARFGNTALRAVRGSHGDGAVATECRNRRARQRQSLLPRVRRP